MRFRKPPLKGLMRREEPATAAIVTVITVLLTGSAFADDPAMRDKLTGKWQSDGNGETWVLTEIGDSVHVSNSSDAQTLAEFDCNTLGKECVFKRSGHKSTVSMWFNGAKLVEVETTGNQVVKRRFTVTGSGDTMEMEIIPIVPKGTSATTHFKRAPAAAAKQ